MKLLKKIKNPVLREIVDWSIHIGIAVIIAILVTKFIIQRTEVQKFSMNPTLVDGDNLVVEKVSPRLGKIERGDIVTIYCPEFVREKGHTMIKRVIAVGGDTVKVEDGNVYVNGKKLKEPYILGNKTEKLGTFVDLKVKKGYYYVLGDNRAENSVLDSRRAGQISSKDISGKALVRLYPFDRIQLF